MKDSTPIRLRLISNISSTSFRRDDRVSLQVLEDVFQENGTGEFVIIKRRATARGTITAVNRTRVMGRHGAIEMAMDDVEVTKYRASNQSQFIQPRQKTTTAGRPEAIPKDPPPITHTWNGAV